MIQGSYFLGMQVQLLYTWMEKDQNTQDCWLSLGFNNIFQITNKNKIIYLIVFNWNTRFPLKAS